MTSPNANDPGGMDRRRFLEGVAATAAGIGISGALPRRAAADENEDQPQGVEHRILGRTGLSVSKVAVGGGGLSPESSRLLNAAVERGLNTFDVAWSYGNGQAEAAVGQFLQGFPDRERVVIFTKASGFRPPQGGSQAVYSAFKDALGQSLGRMRTEYVDVLMWPHGAASPQQLQNPAVREALLKLKEDGLVRHLGFSSHTNYVATCMAGMADDFYDVILTVINICTQNPDQAGQPAPGGRRPGRATEDTRELVRTAKEKNVGLLAMKVANPGYLTPATDALVAQHCPSDPSLSRHQKLYRYGLETDGVSSVVIGMRSVQHLREAIAIGSA